MCCSLRGLLIVSLGLLVGSCSLLFEEAGTGSGGGERLRVWSGSDASHTCASRGNKLVCWGANYEGQLGIGATESVGVLQQADASLVPITFPDPIRDVSMSEHHTCAVTTAGELYCWGRGEDGVLGFGDTGNLLDMIGPANAVPTGAAVRSVAAAELSTCYQTAREVVCLGAGDSVLMCGLLGACQIDTDFGDDEFAREVAMAPLAGAVSEIAMGTAHACALLENGDLQCWGENGYGELADGTMSAETLGVPQSSAFELSQLALGRNFGCAIDRERNVRCWGRSNHGQHGVASTDDVAFLSETRAIDFDEPVETIAAGDEHVCAMYGNPGKVQCWGNGKFGALGRGDSETLGDDEQIALRAPLDLEGVVDIAAGRDHTCVALDTDEVVCWGYNRGGPPEPISVLGWGGVCADLGLALDGGCAWGDESGELAGNAVRLRFDF